MINDFIEEIEVITGGYNAEYGRATGGVVNVVTKSGSNEFKGSVFGYLQPGLLTAAAERTPINAASIDATGDLAYTADFGFELGGPIIKDKLWFFVGFAPAFSQVDYTRDDQAPAPTAARCCRPASCRRATTRSCRARMVTPTAPPDIDPNDRLLHHRPRSTRRSAARRAARTTSLGKINYAATPEHQGQLTFAGAAERRATRPASIGPADQRQQGHRS